MGVRTHAFVPGSIGVHASTQGPEKNITSLFYQAPPSSFEAVSFTAPGATSSHQA